MANNISAGRVESDGATAVDMVMEAGTIVYVNANNDRAAKMQAKRDELRKKQEE